MSTKEMFFTHIQGLQSRADRSGALYPENDCIFPNDAIILIRQRSLNEFAEFVDQMAEQSGKSVAKVLAILKSNENDVKKLFPHIGQAIDAIIKQFGE